MAMPRRLVGMRHFLSEGNVAKAMWRKGIPVPDAIRKVPDRERRLALAAQSQVQATADFLTREYPEGFYKTFVTDHVRTQESVGELYTAAGWGNVRIYIDPMFGERSWGDFDLQSEEVIARGYALREQDPYHWNPTGGETLLSARGRARILLARAARKFAKRDMFVGCHGELLEALFSEVAHMSTESFKEWKDSKHGRVDNGQIIEFASQDPDTGEWRDSLHWYRTSCPQRKKFGKWQPIPRRTYTAADLLANAAKYARFLDDQ